MTNEEAIKILELMRPVPSRGNGKPFSSLSKNVALNIAIEALEKQIPKKVIKYKRIGDVLVGGYCPACDAELHISNRPCYCGQVLNWSDEE